jgi:hypothetical protein
MRVPNDTYSSEAKTIRESIQGTTVKDFETGIVLGHQARSTLPTSALWVMCDMSDTTESHVNVNIAVDTNIERRGRLIVLAVGLAIVLRLRARNCSRKGGVWELHSGSC